jgi:glycerol-3-phosphate dehydrogenase (NAD(P)+)
VHLVGVILSDNKNHKVAVLGGGSFGTAIANMIANNNYTTSLWLRSEENRGKMVITYLVIRSAPRCRLGLIYSRY